MSCRFYGVMAVYATPDLAFGSVISGFFYSFWNLFAGAVFCSWLSFHLSLTYSLSRCSHTHLQRPNDVWVIMASV